MLSVDHVTKANRGQCWWKSNRMLRLGFCENQSKEETLYKFNLVAQNGQLSSWHQQIFFNGRATTYFTKYFLRLKLRVWENYNTQFEASVQGCWERTNREQKAWGVEQKVLNMTSQCSTGERWDLEKLSESVSRNEFNHFFLLLRSKNTETIKFPFLVSYPWPCVVFQHFLSGAVMNAAAARQYMSCSLAVSISHSPVFLFLVLLSSSTSLSLRSTALSWFGVESEWPVVFPHWELPCLQTLSTSTNPCRAKPLCSRTPHSLPAHWVCSKGKSGNSTASVKNAVWNLLWLQRDVMFERSELSGPL